MKKVFSLLLVLAMLLSLCACGEGEEQNNETGSTEQMSTGSTEGLTNDATGTATTPDGEASTPGGEEVNPGEGATPPDAEATTPKGEATTPGGETTTPGTEATTGTTPTQGVASTEPTKPAASTKPTESTTATEATKPAHKHSFAAATCTKPKTCSCGATEGKALGHNYKKATCTAPKTCTKCGAKEGKAAGHSWDAATCLAPKTCSKCSATEGDKLTHDFNNNICKNSGCIKLGYGTWYKINKIEGDSLWATFIFFNNNGSGGIMSYQFIEQSAYPDEIDPSRQAFSYQGKQYYIWTGGGDDVSFEASDDAIMVECVLDEDRTGVVIMERTAYNQMTVTSVVTSFWGMKEGVTLTYEPNFKG